MYDFVINHSLAENCPLYVCKKAKNIRKIVKYHQKWWYLFCSIFGIIEVGDLFDLITHQYVFWGTSYGKTEI